MWLSSLNRWHVVIRGRSQARNNGSISDGDVLTAVTAVDPLVSVSNSRTADCPYIVWASATMVRCSLIPKSRNEANAWKLSWSFMFCCLVILRCCCRDRLEDVCVAALDHTSSEVNDLQDNLHFIRKHLQGFTEATAFIQYACEASVRPLTTTGTCDFPTGSLENSQYILLNPFYYLLILNFLFFCLSYFIFLTVFKS